MANTHKRKLFVVSLGWSKAGLQVAPKTYFESSRVKWCRDVQKGSKNYFELVGGSSSRESTVSIQSEDYIQSGQTANYSSC